MSQALSKGTAYLTISGLIFMGSGYLVQIMVGRFFDPALYGTFGVVLYLLNTFNTILASGFFQGISRSISEKESAAKTILKKGLKIEIVITGAFAILYFLFASKIAAFFGDSSMTYYLRISALLIPIYGVRTVYIGILSGLKRFDKQAIAQILAAIVKVVFVVVFLLLGMSLAAILVAYFFAAVSSLLTASFYSKIKEGTDEYPGRKLLEVTLTISFYSFVFPLLMSMDLFLVKYFTTDSNLTGYYNSSSTLARFLYILLSGFTVSLLPIVSEHFYKNDLAKVQQYAIRAMRFGLLILAPLAIIASITASKLIPFIYSDKYSQAAIPFGILIIGIAVLTLSRIPLTLMVAIGKQAISLYFTLGLLVIDVVLNFVLIPRYGLVGAAWATSSVGIIGLLSSFVYINLKIKRIVNWWSTIKIGFASVLVAIFTKYLLVTASFKSYRIIIWYGIILVFYIVILLLLKELQRGDFANLKSLISRKPKKADPEILG